MSVGRGIGAVRRSSVVAIVSTLVAVSAPLGGVSAPRAAQVAPAAPPSFLTYSRPARYEGIHEAVTVPIRPSGGGPMQCDLGRPGINGAAAPGQFPGIVFEYTPYGAVSNVYGQAPAPEFVTRGYNVLHCDVPDGGQNNLKPSTYSPFTDKELIANYDIIEWLGTRPYSNGRIAQQGNSYGGMTSWRVLRMNPPHLVTISPAAAFNSWYLDWTYPGGIRSPEGFSAFSTASSLGRGAPQEAELANHPYYDSYYTERDIAGKIEHSNIPILAIGCWDDFFANGMTRDYIATRNHAVLVMGTEAHACGSWGRLAWYDHYLMGMDVPLPPARVMSYEMPTATESSTPVGRGWQLLGDWPPSNTGRLRLYLTADRRLADSPGPSGTNSYDVDPNDSSGRSPSAMFAGDPPFPEQSAMDARRLLFTSAPLNDDLVLAGSIALRLRAAFSATDGNLVARLEDITPDGQSYIVSRGWLKASHRLSHSDPMPLTPGDFYDFDIDVWPNHWRFAKGHQIQIAISSGDVPKIVPDAPAGTMTVASGPNTSYVDLPFINGDAPDPGKPGWPAEAPTAVGKKTGNAPGPMRTTEETRTAKVLPATGAGQSVTGLVALAIAALGGLLLRRRPRT